MFSIFIVPFHEDFTTVFAYFEQNVIADANGEPYSVHQRDTVYEAIAYPDESGKEILFEKHEDAMHMMTWKDATRKKMTWQQQ